MELQILLVYHFTVAKGLISMGKTLALGQNYTNITLNVFKSSSKDVTLTSFEKFNIRLTSYQQNSWVANVGGVGVWSQCGNGGAIFSVYTPSVAQRQNIAIILYTV